jgi:hypothetical protein
MRTHCCGAQPEYGEVGKGAFVVLPACLDAVREEESFSAITFQVDRAGRSLTSCPGATNTVSSKSTFTAAPCRDCERQSCTVGKNRLTLRAIGVPNAPAKLSAIPNPNTAPIPQVCKRYAKESRWCGG